MRNKEGITILCATGTYGDETASLENLIKCTAVHNKVLDHRESAAAPGFYGNGCAGFEVTHEQLAGSDLVVRTMCTAVNVQGAGSADTFTAVMVEGNGINSLTDKLIVQDIKHFEERSVFLHIRNVVGLEMAFCFGVSLTPYFYIIFHTRD